MPDRDFNPKDGGFIRVMNEFVDKLTNYPLDSNEWRVIMLVIRRTWGVKGRPSADIPWGILRERTGLANTSLRRSIKKLKDRNILHTIENNLRVTRYKINSKVSTWKTIDQLRAAHGPKKLRAAHRPKSGPPTALSQGRPRPSLGPPTAVTPIKDNIKTLFKDNVKDTPIVPTAKTGHLLTKKEQIEMDARTVIDCINELSGKNFQYSETSLKNVRARLNNGATLEQCLMVCQNKWLDPDHKAKYYRPITLFRPELFESYVNEYGSKRKPTNSRQEKRLAVWQRRFEKHGKESTGQGHEDEDTPH